MFVRRAHGSEDVAEGEFVVSYVDATMSNKKEDGFSTLSAIYLALKQYKEENPWVKHVAVKTDGAGAYAGIVFTVLLPLTTLHPPPSPPSLALHGCRSGFP